MCDLRDATSAEEAQSALVEVEDQLDDLGSKCAMYTAEDRQDIQGNLADLAEHAVQGNEVLLQQDLIVLRRSADNIQEDLSEVSRAAWEGVAQGLSECTD